RLVEFYERATGVRAMWATEDFAELKTPKAALAIAGTRTVPLFAPGSAHPADNRSVIIEFRVDDVDRVHQNLTGFVTEPTTMPWGVVRPLARARRERPARPLLPSRQ
ncbi:VOC family protein, partial [Nonomuraea helvata]